MTGSKRFDLVCDNNVEWLMQSELFLPIKDKNTNKRITLKECHDLLNSLGEEEQLKVVVKEVIELLSEEVDVFSDKATEHDINAYIELKELDNKDAYYIATATKKAIKLLKGVVR